MEDEVHFLLHCSKIDDPKEIHVTPYLKSNVEYDTMNDLDRISWLVSENQMKEFGKMLAIMYDARQAILYKSKKA